MRTPTKDTDVDDSIEEETNAKWRMLSAGVSRSLHVRVRVAALRGGEPAVARGAGVGT
jgi:hypothetical protein